MRTNQVCTAAALALLIAPVSAWAGTISGKVTVDGPVPKQKVIDMSKEPACAKDYPASDPPKTETATVGAGNALADVVVYISAGANDEGTVPPTAVTLDQHGCRYIKHVTALHVNQDMKVTNSDPTSHNIHPLAKTNREWNKSQPPGAPPQVPDAVTVAEPPLDDVELDRFHLDELADFPEVHVQESLSGGTPHQSTKLTGKVDITEPTEPRSAR